MDVWVHHPIITIPARTRLPLLRSLVHRIILIIIFSHILMARIAAPGDIIHLYILAPVLILRRARTHILHQTLIHSL